MRLHMHDYLRGEYPGIVIQSDGLHGSDDAMRLRARAGTVDMTATHRRWTYRLAHDEYHRYPGILPACNEAGPKGLTTSDPEDVRSTMWGLTMGGGVAYIEQDGQDYEHFKPIPYELHGFFHPASDQPRFWTMEPRIDLVVDNADGGRYVLADEAAREILVFVPRAAGRSTFQVRGAGSYESRWFTADGERSSWGSWSTGNSWAFTPPVHNAGLQIRKRDGGTEPEAGVVWERDYFDRLSLGPLAGQGNWTRGSAGEPSAEVVTREEWAKMLKVDLPEGSEAAILMGKRVASQSGGRHRLSFEVRSDGAHEASLAKIEVQGPSGGSYPRLFQIYVGSSIRVNYGPTAGETAMLVEQTVSGRWYRVECDMDLGARRLDVSIDGRRRADALPMQPGPIVSLGLAGWGRAGTVHFDRFLGMALPTVNPLPEPNHPLDFGYYQVTFKDPTYFPVNRRATDDYTTLYHADVYSSYSTDLTVDEWAVQFDAALATAVRDRRRIHLSLELRDDGALARMARAIEIAAPYWDSVVRIELADENNGWGQRQLDARIAKVKGELARHGLAPRGLGIVCPHNEPLPPTVGTPAVSWIGIECYLDPPEDTGDPAANRTLLNSRVGAFKQQVPAGKDIVLVGMAYDRNNGWANMETLRALQADTYLLAHDDPRVVSLNLFAYGRLGGTAIARSSRCFTARSARGSFRGQTITVRRSPHRRRRRGGRDWCSATPSR